MSGQPIHALKACDIMSSLPEELLLITTGFLDVASLLRLRAVNKRYQTFCSKDEAGWEALCSQLWEDKIFVCNDARFSSPNAMTAYQRSLTDAKTRQHIRPEEFCFDPENEEGPIWSFRFKEAAGPDWTSWDPWWNNRPARQMVFLKDGAVKQYLQSGAEYAHDLLLRDPQQFGQPLPVSGNILMDSPVSMTWRFCNCPMDLPKRPHGSYLRLAVGGRDVPTYVMRRSPTGNWGFVSESCWGVYASFTLPPRKVNEESMQQNVASTSEPQESVGEDNQQAAGTPVVLTDDSSFVITNEVQWREALLYNFGATVLPEGDTAAEDFDRMFGHTWQDRRPGGAGVDGGAATRSTTRASAASNAPPSTGDQQPQNEVMEE